MGTPLTPKKILHEDMELYRVLQGLPTMLAAA